MLLDSQHEFHTEYLLTKELVTEVGHFHQLLLPKYLCLDSYVSCDYYNPYGIL